MTFLTKAGTVILMTAMSSTIAWADDSTMIESALVSFEATSTHSEPGDVVLEDEFAAQHNVIAIIPKAKPSQPVRVAALTKRRAKVKKSARKQVRVANSTSKRNMYKRRLPVIIGVYR